MIPILVLLAVIQTEGAVLPPRWADPERNPCAVLPGGWLLLYWPPDGRCYRIFTVGSPGPCPHTMELAPGPEGVAECRCPPGSAKEFADSPCHTLYGRGPCPRGFYFAPSHQKSETSYKHWGICKKIETCKENDHLFWAKTSKCYKEFTRGPCPKGELLVKSEDGELPECQCEKTGLLSLYYWQAGHSCYEHYTSGPCFEHGNLFLPGGTCGCYLDMPHYHTQTGKCYELGGQGPCNTGHQFLLLPGERYATCVCKESHILWIKDGVCYHQYTRGPCSTGHFVINSTDCLPLPCRQGQLYFPEENACYKVGTRGPCPEGQIVLFENSVRPSVNGVSYRGMCGCPQKPNCESSTSKDMEDIHVPCESKPGRIKWNGTCYSLYSKGPCSENQWLVPDRESKHMQNEHGWKRKTVRVKCECRPGFKSLKNIVNDTIVLQCQSPTVALARYLNNNFYFIRDS